MSLYNQLHKMHIGTILFLPLIDETPKSIPRFRDAFPNKRQFRVKDGFPMMSSVEEMDDEFKITHVHVLTRVGGGNRDDYQEEIEQLRSNPHYVSDEDDSFDSTYAMFKFKIPEEFLNDVWHLQAGGLPKDTTQEYKDKLYAAYPDKFDLLHELFTMTDKKKEEQQDGQ